MIIEDEIVIYTDGSCKEKPRRGGIGIRFIFPDYSNGTESFDDYSLGSYVGATNQQMELMACIIALEKCLLFENHDKLKTITLCVDSNYVKTNIENAKFVWPKRKWTLKDGVTPIENVDLWERLIKILKKHNAKVHFEKVKAHRRGKNKDIHNAEVDSLAKKGADCQIEIPFNVINARKKYSPNIAKKGCVRITTDPVNIRIINCTSYKKHKNLFKLKYVVTSKDNSDYNLLDWAYNDTRLYEGHTYTVIMETRDKMVFIKEVIDDITKTTKLRLINKLRL